MRVLPGAVMLWFSVIVFSVAFAGCKPDVKGGGGEGEGGEGKAHVMTSPGSRQVAQEIPPQAAALIDSEFSGIDLDVAADGPVKVYLEPGSGGEVADGLLLNEVVFTARTPGRGETRLAGPSAVVDPSNKRVVFESSATVEGPGGNLLEAETLIWYYDRDVLEVDGPFTLTNGRGITTGTKCVTDVGFRSIQLF